MDALKAMRVFVRAVDLGSLSAVARALDSTQPNVSKVVAALERDVGARLFVRSAKGLEATEEGRRFYERAQRILEDYEEALAEARETVARPSGTLRFNAPLALGELRLNALMLEFLQHHPEIRVEMILNDRLVDLAEEGIDVALRQSDTLPLNVVAREVAASDRYLSCAPAYLKGCAAIKRPQDLAGHEYLEFAWAATPGYVTLTDGSGNVRVKVDGRYRVNSSMAIRESLLAGAGVGMTPAWLVEDLVRTGQLVRVLPRYQGAVQRAYLLYPSRRHLPGRTRALLDFLSTRLPQIAGFTPVRT
ncbi:LysR family transcriptional regulator [Polaromonas sp. SM01]|uniref:LysR family transcriptional regulator n=1 Tax=Polaromonas sp. SM01 TaxID=3085630 RepID=UPI002980B71D|nr:LysR family transcriptional regulator [Polaromonas sp. SM01]MDW5441500.1 LysR family transcriptional regulator [Polaromonas sp. SM01]